MAFKGKTSTGGKNSIKQLMVLVSDSVTKKKKTIQTIISKTAKPQHFKGIRSLLTDYRLQRSWIVSDIFGQWLKGSQNNEEVYVFVDN